MEFYERSADTLLIGESDATGAEVVCVSCFAACGVQHIENDQLYF